MFRQIYPVNGRPDRRAAGIGLIKYVESASLKKEEKGDF